MNPVAISIFGLDVMWYGIVICSGTMLALLLRWPCYSWRTNCSSNSCVYMYKGKKYKAFICTRHGSTMYYISPSHWKMGEFL